jgi:hypothetical protein
MAQKHNCLSRHSMLGFQEHPAIELSGTLKNTKMREGETKSLIKTK